MALLDDTQTQDSSSDTVDSLTSSEIDELVRKALEDYQTERRSDDAENVSTINGAIVNVGDSVTSLASDVSDNTEQLEQVLKAVESESSTVVVLSDTQWTEIQQCWGWAKNAAAVCLFLVLVTTLLVSALFGSRVWDSFTKGWRH